MTPAIRATSSPARASATSCPTSRSVYQDLMRAADSHRVFRASLGTQAPHNTKGRKTIASGRPPSFTFVTAHGPGATRPAAVGAAAYASVNQRVWRAAGKRLAAVGAWE